eukprot:TRINITY_DN9041_c0_g1_i1.p1 TRINITY_DN9041_c0_g1~~TRINITY_DN9041_c0_g1_i1.p1  ORF type:complete len:213 (+),score=46.55 TRINITY_DN9041_c0_g1_i1:32-670(+)
MDIIFDDVLFGIIKHLKLNDGYHFSLTNKHHFKLFSNFEEFWKNHAEQYIKKLRINQNTSLPWKEITCLLCEYSHLKRFKNSDKTYLVVNKLLENLQISLSNASDINSLKSTLQSLTSENTLLRQFMKKEIQNNIELDNRNLFYQAYQIKDSVYPVNFSVLHRSLGLFLNGTGFDHYDKFGKWPKVPVTRRRRISFSDEEFFSISSCKYTDE